MWMDENKVKKNNSSGAGSMDEQDLARLTCLHNPQA